MKVIGSTSQPEGNTSKMQVFGKTLTNEGGYLTATVRFRSSPQVRGLYLEAAAWRIDHD